MSKIMEFAIRYGISPKGKQTQLYRVLEHLLINDKISYKYLENALGVTKASAKAYIGRIYARLDITGTKRLEKLKEIYGNPSTPKVEIPLRKKLELDEIAEYVINMRQSVGWTQADLARELDESEKFVKRIESGVNCGLRKQPFMRTVRMLVVEEQRRRREGVKIG
jgi:DNA-binding XRE family transcriptional regulator